MPRELIVYRRAELFERVWARPVQVVAKEYGITGTALAKICKKLAVPVPNRGHWARKAAGQTVEQPPLGKLPKGAPEEMRVWRQVEPPESPPSPEAQANVDREARLEATIDVPATLHRPHELVVAAMKFLKNTKPNEHGLLAKHREACLDIVVSPAMLDRALRLMDALLKALESRGLEVQALAPPPYGRGWDASHGTRVLVRDDWVRFRLMEKTTIQRPEPYKGPASKRPLYTAPSVRMPNGRFELTIISPHPEHTWRDGAQRKVEHCLNEFVARLYLLADAATKRRAEAEQRRRAEEAARERQAEAERRAQAEAKRATDLIEAVKGWRLAKDIREFVAAAKAASQTGDPAAPPDAKFEAQLGWALAYANRIDPLSSGS